MSLPSDTVAEYLRQKWVATADKDYIAARICEDAFLLRQFAWHAAQAIEKYSKCILVLNGVCIKNISHTTFDKLARVDPEIFDLLPSEIDLSPNYKIRPTLLRFAKERFDEACKRLERQGHPNSRYRETHLQLRPYDLQKLDFIVYHLRRLCFPLLSKRHVLCKIAEDSDSSPNRDIQMVPELARGYETQMNALRRDNVMFFPEVASLSKGALKAGMEMTPRAVEIALCRLTSEDKKWLNHMTTEKFKDT